MGGVTCRHVAPATLIASINPLLLAPAFSFFHPQELSPTFVTGDLIDNPESLLCLLLVIPGLIGDPVSFLFPVFVYGKTLDSR